MKSMKMARNIPNVIYIIIITISLFLSADFAYTTLKKVGPDQSPGIKDPVFHHGFRPYFNGYRVWGTERYRFFTNSLGFADRAPRPVDVTTSKYRILFLGDSITEGLGVPYDDTFVGIFSAALDQNRIEVLNAAVASYSPTLYYRKLRYFLERGLKVDELFVFLDISDIQDEAVWARDGIAWAEKPWLVDPYTLTMRPPPAPSKLRDIKIWLSRRLALTSGCYRFIKELLAGRKANEAGAPPWDWPRGAWTIDKAIFKAWGRDGLARCGEYMEKIAELCRQHHIKLRMAVYPWPHQILYNDLESIQVKYWQEFCTSRHIPLLNYFPYFVGRGKAADVVKDFYIRGDLHFNRNGHRRVAEILIDQWRALALSDTRPPVAARAARLDFPIDVRRANRLRAAGGTAPAAGSGFRWRKDRSRE